MTDRNGDTRNDDDAPEPVRPETVQERERVSPSQQEDPPKAEGDRDEAEDGEGGDRGDEGNGDRAGRED